MNRALLLSLTLLAGCAYRPNIDLHGVDINRYEADMRDCETSAADAGFSFSNPIADCMVKRGYRINHTYQ